MLSFLTVVVSSKLTALFFSLGLATKIDWEVAATNCAPFVQQLLADCIDVYGAFLGCYFLLDSAYCLCAIVIADKPWHNKHQFALIRRKNEAEKVKAQCPGCNKVIAKGELVVRHCEKERPKKRTTVAAVPYG